MADAPPTPHVHVGADYEAVRNLLSPSGDWSAETYDHLFRLKRQIARLMMVGLAASHLRSASPSLTKAAEVVDDRPWPDERSIIIYLERPEACNNDLLDNFLQTTVAYVGERVEGLDIMNWVEEILLAVDTRTSEIRPSSPLSLDEACGSTNGISADGVACGFWFHRLLFPFYADREVEVGPARISGEAMGNTGRFDVLIGEVSEVASARLGIFADQSRSDAAAVLPKLLAHVSLFESENVELTAFRRSLDNETMELEEMAQEIILKKDKLTEIVREAATLNTDLTALEARLIEIGGLRKAARDSFDIARKPLDDARVVLTGSGAHARRPA